MKANQVERIITKTFLKKEWLHLIFLTLLLAAASCGLFENKKDAEPPPGRRDYTWTVDSVYSAPNGWIYDIWGAKPNDVWAVSPGGAYHLWHYDGKSWSPDSNRNLYGLHSIYGFSSDNIWAGGEDGHLYHFDGKQWNNTFTYVKDKQILNYASDIWGNSRDNVYAVGLLSLNDGKDFNVYSYLLHYNGKQWQEEFVTDFGIQLQRVRQDNNGVFLFGINNGEPDSSFIFNYKNGQLNKLLSISNNEISADLWMNNIEKNIYFLVGSRLKHYRIDNFETIRTFDIQDGVDTFFARNYNDIFLINKNGLLHYNGKNVIYLLNRVSNSVESFVANALVLDKEVFFVVRDFHDGTNLIYHGVLPQEEKETMP